MMKLIKIILATQLAFIFSNIEAIQASTPQAWEQHYQQMISSCLTVSGLKNPHPVGKPISFSDQVGYDALLIEGTYPQPHMNNQVGQVLCLFNRFTRQSYITDADDLISETLEKK